MSLGTDPPASCEEIGGVRGLGSGWAESPEENAKTEVRNNAAERGANVVRLETMTKTPDYGHVTMTGTAHKCVE